MLMRHYCSARYPRGGDPAPVHHLVNDGVELIQRDRSQRIRALKFEHLFLPTPCCMRSSKPLKDELLFFHRIAFIHRVADWVCYHCAA
jgi:hypothetical protein